MNKFNIGDKVVVKISENDAYYNRFPNNTYAGIVTQVLPNGTVYVDRKYFLQEYSNPSVIEKVGVDERIIKAQQELRYWLNSYPKGDWFSAKLFDLIAKADVYNLEKIRKGFPEKVAAWEKYQREGEFWSKGADNE